LSSNYERDYGKNGLEPILELKTVVSQVKTIYKGDSVSYGRTFTAENDVRIASLTVGYADGYPRSLSSKGEALVHGVRCKVVGRVCMDQLMLDVSGVPHVQAGDVVTLIGADGSEEIRADYLASLYNTIPHEVVCGISNRVTRIYV
jgi:alanine racemase